jgi:hypothetical protein
VCGVGGCVAEDDIFSINKMTKEKYLKKIHNKIPTTTKDDERRIFMSNQKNEKEGRYSDESRE